MIRNFILLVATVGVIALLFVGYTMLVADPSAEDARPGTKPNTVMPDQPRDAAALHVRDDMELPGGDAISFTIYDEQTGQPKERFRCDEWTPISKTEAAVKKPELAVLLPSGMVALISADAGRLTAERFQRSRMRPRTGTLEGHARIVIDTETRPDRTPADERPDDLITITMDSLHFDAERGELKTDGPVSLTSREFEISGTGLELLWNQAGNRIETLTLRQGKQLTLNSGGGLFRGLTGTNPGERQPGNEATGNEAKTTSATAGAAPPENGANAQAAPKAARPAKKPSAYLCTLEGGVTAEHWRAERRVGRLEAGELRLTFDVGGGANRLLDRDAPAEKTAATKPAAETAERLIVRWNGPLTLGPTTPPAKGERPRRRLEALGPVVKLESGDATVLCGRLEYQEDTQQIWLYRGEDGRVNFTTDAGLQADAESVYVDRKRNLVKLLGEVWLNSGGGRGDAEKPGIISCNQWAELRLAAVNKGAEGSRGQGANERAASDSPGMDDQLVAFGQIESATFVGGVILQMDEQTLMAHQFEAQFTPLAEPSAAEETPERGLEPGAAALQARLDSAVATGQVQLLAKNQSLDCGRLELRFARTEQGRLYPRRLEAGGAVVMKQDRTKLQGEKVIAELAPLPAADASKKTVIALRTLDVFEKAELIDPKSKVAARGQRIAATFAGENDLQTAAVHGTAERFARVYAQPYIIRGQTIWVERAAQTLRVEGPSKLSFKSKRGLQGQERFEPLPVVVTSTRLLRIDGLQNKVEFDGEVVAKSGDEKLQADSLTLILEDVAEGPPVRAAAPRLSWAMFRQMLAGRPPAPAANPTPRLAGDPLRAGDGRRVRKEPVRLIARNGVAESESYEFSRQAGQPPLMHSSLSAPLLEADLPQRLIRATGQTTLLLTSRRLGQDGNPEPDSVGLPSGLLTRGPSQTAIQCDGMMTYALGPEGPRRRDTVLFDGGVVFVHRAGREMLDLEQTVPEVRQKPELIATFKSRNTYLKCRRLECEFVSGEAGEARAGGALSGASLRLNWLLASGDAYLRDRQGPGIRTVQADRLEFDRARGVVHVAGAPGADARIHFENPESGEAQTPMIGPELAIDLNTNTVRSGRVIGDWRRASGEAEPARKP